MFERIESIVNNIVIAIMRLGERTTELEERLERLEKQSMKREEPSVDKGYED